MAGIQAEACTALNINSLWYLLNELCDVRSKWKYIGLGLGVPRSDLDTMSGDPLDCLESILTKWLKGADPPPTWEALVAVLRSPVVGEEKKAQELDEKFCISTSLPSDMSTPMPNKESATCEPLQASWSFSESSDGSMASPTSMEREKTPFSDQLSPRSVQSADDEGLQLSSVEADVDDSHISSRAKPSLLNFLERIKDPEVKKMAKQKDMQFRTLVTRTCRYLSCTITTRGKRFYDFKIAITLMPASLRGHHMVLSPDDRQAISRAKSFSEIFIILNQYWTFAQYELLEYVVQKYGSVRLKKKMHTYVDGMDEFEEQISINHFTPVKLCSPRPDSVAMKIHLPGSKHRLRDARNVQRSMAEQCGLHPHTVRTYQSIPGSTILTLLIPYSVAGHVMATLQGMLPTGDLLSRPLEDRIVYETENLPLSVPEIPDSSILTVERRGRRSEDSSQAPSTGYDTSEGEVDMVGEPSSQIAMLTRALREKEKEVEGIQRKLLELRSKGNRAVYILGSVAPHSNKSMVPQSPANLSGADRQKLTELDLPPDKWDNLHALLAMYYKSKTYDVFSVQVSKLGTKLSRKNVLKQIESLLKDSVNKEGAIIHYYGNGRRNTGDWCFRDGYITFRDIANLYMKYSRGRVLTLVSDCHSSGDWVGQCAKFLDEQGVRPCGHSATEKGILLKVYAACEAGQDTAELCYFTRAIELKKDGAISHCRINKKLSDQQRAFGVDFTKIRCGKGKEEECSIASDSTWSTAREVIDNRLLTVRGTDRQDRPTWNIVLLDDDVEKIRDLKHKFQRKNITGTIDVRDYGVVLKSGLGKDIPRDVQHWIENYGKHLIL